MAMISNSNAVITGGVFNQNIDQRQTQKNALDRLQEAVSPSAFHNSGDRFDPPKCHPLTRVAVRDKVEKWALRMDPNTRDASILWWSGAAGAGKSAIAQTLAEHFDAKDLLVATFFFGRSDSTRNHARSLVSTIVYQLYSSLPSPDQCRILAVIDRDPLIFTKSLLAQFEALIVNPLQPLFDSGTWTRRVIIIDGLDECLDRGMQRNVLLMLSAAVQQFHSPFVFLLASRPEHDIAAMFGSPDFLHIHARLFLDDTYLPDRDIELFLRDQFAECRTTHPFRHMIPPDWPSDDIVQKLTSKSSGQFIYASVVAKYVKSFRHRPHHRLDVVLNIRPALKDLPFAELDALYTHIFSSVDNIECVLDIISFHIIFQKWVSNIDDIERILRLDPGEVAIMLCDLPSIISYEKGQTGIGNQLKILHTSLADYLLDSTRSKEYFIDTTKYCTEHIANCFRFLSHVECRDALIFTAYKAMSCFQDNHLSLDLSEPVYTAIRGFSISRIFKVALNMTLLVDQSFVLRPLLLEFLPALFKFLKKSDSAKYLELYQHHQSEYDLVFVADILKARSLESATSLVLAVVTIYRKLPVGAFQELFSPVNSSSSNDGVLAALQLHLIWSTHLVYLEYLSDFLQDPNRSQEFCTGPKLFAQAAKHCLLYLCDHTAFTQRAPPRMSAQQRLRRKYTPWKWHRRVIREDIRGQDDTPWLWLRHPIYLGVSPTRVLHRKTNDLIYIHSPNLIMSWPSESNDPVVNYRVCSEKYHLALAYLNYFLPKAAKLDDLVHMCQKLTLASLSRDFPRKSARARSNMQKYAAQWG